MTEKTRIPEDFDCIKAPPYPDSVLNEKCYSCPIEPHKEEPNLFCSILDYMLAFQNKWMYEMENKCPCFECLVLPACSAVCVKLENYIDYLQATEEKIYDEWSGPHENILRHR